MRGCPTNSPCRTPGTRARRGPLLMGISTKGKSPVGSPRCSPHDGSLLSPGGTTTGRLLLDQPSAPVEAASHDLNRGEAAVNLVFDKVSWSDTPAFHNTLVVGSSPTSSTTQSPTTEEILARPSPRLSGAS